MRLANRHVVVTGAGRGIGETLAAALAAEGAAVTCLDIDGEAAAATARDIRSAGWSARDDRCDITDLEQVQAALEGSVSDFGDVAVLVANAGGAAGERSPFLDLTAEAWRRMVD